MDAQRALRPMPSAHEQTAAEVFSLGETIDPSDRVLPVAAVRGKAKELIEIGDRKRLDLDIGRADGLERKLDPQNEPGQPEPADGRLEKLNVVALGKLEHVARRSRKTDAADVAANGASAFVIFAMHIVGDGPSQSDEFRARRNRQEPALGNGDPQQFIECQTGLGADNPSRPVGIDHPIERRCTDERAIAIDANVAVRARGSNGQH